MFYVWLQFVGLLCLHQLSTQAFPEPLCVSASQQKCLEVTNASIFSARVSECEQSSDILYTCAQLPDDFWI